MTVTDRAGAATVPAPHPRRVARVVLLAGASGSGKTRLSRRLGLPTVALDDFYRDGDDPVLLARYPGGLDTVDWDDPVTWDCEAAADTLAALCADGEADIPRYDIPSNRRVGCDRVALHGSRVVVAEGIFAAELVAPLARRLLLADAIYLDRSRTATFARRLARDLVEGRKPPHVLVSRGLRLTRGEPALRSRWAALGCRPLSRDGATAVLEALSALPGVAPACINPWVDHLRQLEDGVAAFAATLDTADLDAPVERCPGWSVRDLAVHLGETHDWARVAAVERRKDGQGPAAPTGRDDLVAWYRRAGRELVAALRALDAGDPAWTFGLPRTVAFWIRRQAHETAVHLHDLARATGKPYVMDPALAADGVDEVVTVLWPRQVAKGRAGAPAGAVVLEAAEGGRWVLADPARDGDGPAPVATVAGPAEALVLLLWGRARLDDAQLTITGDREAARLVLDRAVTP